MTDKEETNREGRKEREGRRRKKEELFTRQLFLDRLLAKYMIN
ncbi:hypothetical protein [Anabaena sp. PCC 7938]|nr:hypothetical protein [Anabaena sp. CCAP 1446/1C]